MNFMMDDEGEARIKATYGGNFERLAALKQKFDPANLFRVTKISDPQRDFGPWRPAPGHIPRSLPLQRRAFSFSGFHRLRHHALGATGVCRAASAPREP